MNRVWIVEMLNEERSLWEATVGAALSRHDGREQVERWRNDNPCVQFRLRRYAADGVKTKGGGDNGIECADKAKLGMGDRR